MSRTFIIAEAGSSHDGDLEKAFRLTYIASQAGASAIKWQYWSSPERMAERRNAPEKAWAFRKHQFPSDWLEPLRLAAKKRGLEFLCTVYLPEDLLIVTPLVSCLKIGSFEGGDADLLQAALDTGKPVICSTGLMDDVEVRTMVALRGDHTYPKFLHCVSAYPAPLQSLNLLAITHYGLDGYSDHSGHELMGALAVAHGAKIIEVHFRDDRTAPDNPDFQHSLDPRRLAAYVNNIRIAELAAGTGERVADNPAETAMRPYRVRS